MVVSLKKLDRGSNSNNSEKQKTPKTTKERGISFAATRSFPEQKNIELLFRIFVSAKKFHFEARTDLFFQWRSDFAPAY